MENILISGGTGFIGKHVIAYLLATNPAVQLTVLVRSLEGLAMRKNVTYVLWDIEKQYIAPEVSEKIDTVIHLAGANIAEKRWTKERKASLLKSRTESSKLLVEWIKTKGKQVKTMVSASGIGWYGEGQPGQIFTEGDASGTDFLSQVCVQWEASTKPLEDLGVRVVWVRTGLVLDSAGGMWKALQQAFTFRVAPRFGSGEQIYSWIALQDIVRLYIFAAEHTAVKGPINAVSPYPLKQLDLVRALAKKESAFHFVFPIPAAFLDVLLGELAIELVKSAEVDAQKILSAGFVFAQPRIQDL